MNPATRYIGGLVLLFAIFVSCEQPNGSTGNPVVTFTGAKVANTLGGLPTPSASNTGNLYYVLDVGKFYYSNGNAWVFIDLLGPQGTNGISITWLGTLAAAPSTPSTNAAYYDSTQNASFIWDGSSWNILAVDAVFPATPGATTIASIGATSALVGSTGKVRIQLLDFAAADTTVTLASSNTGVATVPGTATIVAGSRSVEVAYAGVSAGPAVFTATLGTSVLYTTARIVNSWELASVTGPVTLQTGAWASINVALNFTANADTIVSLSSSNPTVISVPSTVTARAFTTGIPVSVTGGTVGSTVITATLGTSTKSMYMDVKSAPSIENSALSPGTRMQVNTVATLTLWVDMIVGSDTTITLASSQPAVVSVPTSMKIPAGMTSASIPLTAAAAGTSTLTATLGATTYSCIFVVENVPVITSMSTANRVQVGFPAWLAINTSSAPVSDTTIALSTSDTSVLTLPASALMIAGRSSINVPIIPSDAGNALITATLGSNSFYYLVEVVAAPVIQDVYLVPIAVYQGAQVSRMEAGAVGAAYVRLDANVADNTQIAITNSAPTIISIPTAFTIGYGTNQAMIPVTALTAGTATVTVTVGSSSSTLAVNVTTTPWIYFVSQTRQAYAGTYGTIQVVLDTIVATDTTVYLTSSNPTALEMPASVTIPANQTTMYVQTRGLVAATGITITATLGTSSAISSGLKVAAP